MIKIVTGLRRCGKSFLLFNLFYDHLKKNGVDDAHIIKVDLEDRRNKELRNPDAFHSALRALGWSISIPDISQSNSRQERFRTSDCFLGH